MRSHKRGVRRPLTDEELESVYVTRKNFGGLELKDIVQKISLEEVSLEERRKEAKKPLYISRV